MALRIVWFLCITIGVGCLWQKGALAGEETEKTIKLEDKIMQIRDILTDRDEIPFDTLIKTSKSKGEVIIGFLALLELIKAQDIRVAQKGSFGPILIKKNKE